MQEAEKVEEKPVKPVTVKKVSGERVACGDCCIHCMQFCTLITCIHVCGNLHVHAYVHVRCILYILRFISVVLCLEKWPQTSPDYYCRHLPEIHVA